jgi:hypothetical protein
VIRRKSAITAAKMARCFRLSTAGWEAKDGAG